MPTPTARPRTPRASSPHPAPRHSLSHFLSLSLFSLSLSPSFSFSLGAHDTRSPLSQVDDVAADVKTRRLGELMAEYQSGRARCADALVGQTQLVLVEGAPKRQPPGDDEPRVQGRTDSNRTIVFKANLPDGETLRPGDFAHVRVDHATPNLHGTALRRAQGARG